MNNKISKEFLDELQQLISKKLWYHWSNDIPFHFVHGPGVPIEFSKNKTIGGVSRIWLENKEVYLSMNYLKKLEKGGWNSEYFEPLTSKKPHFAYFKSKNTWELKRYELFPSYQAGCDIPYVERNAGVRECFMIIKKFTKKEGVLIRNSGEMFCLQDGEILIPEKFSYSYQFLFDLIKLVLEAVSDRFLIRGDRELIIRMASEMVLNNFGILDFRKTFTDHDFEELQGWIREIQNGNIKKFVDSAFVAQRIVDEIDPKGRTFPSEQS